MKLSDKVRRMAELLDEEAIASALKLPVETVRGILNGTVSLDEPEETESKSVIQVSMNPVYRQRIISVWRAKGGAGCTSVALHLAYALEQIMSVLLIDLNLAEGGSDLGYYLKLSGYPNIDAIAQNHPLDSAVVQAEPGLWVLQPSVFPKKVALSKEIISKIVLEARREFDAVIFDLPNTETEDVLEAVSCSNMLVLVTTGMYQEMSRALTRKNKACKDVILVANGYKCTHEIRKAFETNRIVEIPQDQSLLSRMERGVFFKKGTPMTSAAEQIKTMLFGSLSQDEGRFRKVMKYLGFKRQ